MSTKELTIEEISSATVIWYKVQRVLRTIVATLISALSIWAALTAVAPQILDELATILPGPWVAWLAGVIAAISAVAGAISRIMAIPKVNAWLTKWLNLGSVPRSALVQESSANRIYPPAEPTVTVAPDPKAVDGV